MLDEGRGLVVAGDENVRERLVVAQQHVEARPQALDQVGLEQQRLGFRARRHELHRGGGHDHPHDAVGLALQARVARHPLLQRARLADVKNRAFLVEHAIDARPERQTADEMRDDVDAARVRPERRGLGLERRHGNGRAAFGRQRILVLAGLVGIEVVGKIVVRQIVVGGNVFFASGHSAMPTTSGVSQARCWPPSRAIIWPVIDGVSHR